MRIFGDDGFRDVYGHKLMRQSFLNNFFNGLNFFLKEKKIDKIYIGYDTRNSCKKILKIILKKIVFVKKIYIFKKPITTPCNHFMSKRENSFNIMITASHFSSKYNGFKFFYKGKKLKRNEEKKIEKNIFTKKKIKNRSPKVYETTNQRYCNFINNKFKIKINKKILIDYSFGSAASLIKDINFLSKFSNVSCKYNGDNINKNCGSNYLKKNLKSKYKNYDYCFAFDGDADRILFSEKNYGLIESEKIALIFIKFLKKKIKNPAKKLNIVGTNITNPWLKENLNKKKFTFYYSKVGDRNVINKQIEKNATLAFETSGHFSFFYRMDGLYSLGLFLEILQKDESLIKEILNKKIDYNCRIISLNQNSFKKSKKILKKVNNIKKIKTIFRKSIWSKKKKIYFFFKKENYDDVKKTILNLVRNNIKIKFEKR